MFHSAAWERMNCRPRQKQLRFQNQYALREHDAQLLTASRAQADFFEAAVSAHGEARTVANWILRDVRAALGEQQIEIEDAAIAPESLAALIALVETGKTTARSARELVPELVARGGDPVALIRERGLEAVSDTGVIEGLVDEVIAAHADDVEKYRGGETKVLNFLMGQVMQRTQGKANPSAVRELLSLRLPSRPGAS